MSYFETTKLENIAGNQINPATEDTLDDVLTVIEDAVDGTTTALRTVDYAHHEIHSGSHYFVKNWMDLTNGQVFNFLAVTSNSTSWAHMLFAFSFEAEAHINIYEDSVVSANGTAVTTRNRNRNSNNTSGLLLYHTPTITDVGTEIEAYKVGSGKGVGGEVRGNAELVLKQNTNYIIRLTNDTVTNNWVDYLADWYEHTNR